MRDSEPRTETQAHDEPSPAHGEPAPAHGHQETAEPLGEPDVRGWGTALLGGGIGLLVALALFIATQS